MHNNQETKDEEAEEAIVENYESKNLKLKMLLEILLKMIVKTR